MSKVHWNIAVSPEADQSLRMFLASQGGVREGDLARFIEDAVCARILELSAAQVKTANAGVSDVELSAVVDEAVQWADKR